MSYHPHEHCIVPGGGVDLNGKWRNVKGDGKFLFPVKALSKVFRGKMMKQLIGFTKTAGMEFPSTFTNKLHANSWIVYAKPPFGGAQGVIKYLARYATKIAISHHRILSHDQNGVQFAYTDYKHKNQKKILTLTEKEFIRRFITHFLPKGFCKIRHFGILSSSWKERIFPDADNHAQSTDSIWLNKGLDIDQCKKCGEGNLILIGEIDPVRGPPHLSKSRLTNVF